MVQVPQVPFMVTFDVPLCVQRQRLGRDSAENCFFGGGAAVAVRLTVVDIPVVTQRHVLGISRFSTWNWTSDPEVDSSSAMPASTVDTWLLLEEFPVHST